MPVLVWISDIQKYSSNDCKENRGMILYVCRVMMTISSPLENKFIVTSVISISAVLDKGYGIQVMGYKWWDIYNVPWQVTWYPKTLLGTRTKYTFFFVLFFVWRLLKLVLIYRQIVEYCTWCSLAKSDANGW